jgi:hypothetical protein
MTRSHVANVTNRLFLASVSATKIELRKFNEIGNKEKNLGTA